MNYHTLTIDTVFKELKTSNHGLTKNEVLLRRETYGENRLPEKRKQSKAFMFLKQFHSALVYILVIAAIISFVFEHGVDGYVILAVIIINAIIGFIQELRAEHAVEALKHLMIVTATVIRDNTLIKLQAHELVPGDIIVLNEGDRVPADARVIQERGLKTLESALTGESTPVEKDIEPIPEKTQLGDRSNMVWMGTLVTSGAGQAIVVETGTRTVIGTIAHDVASIKPKKTHFRKRTNELAWMMGVIAIAGAVITLFFGLFFRQLPFIEIFLFSVASLVSSIPEGLPAVLTIVLAIGAFRMARAKAIIRHLPSTETLSVVTVIATDKTGTLTENSMTIRKILLGTGELFQVTGQGWNPTGEFLLNKTPVVPLDHAHLSQLLHASMLGSAARVVQSNGKFDIIGDPTEAALTVLGEKAGLSFRNIESEAHLIDELPFEREHKYRARLVGNDTHRDILVIGAFERVLEQSNKIIGAKTSELSKTQRNAFIAQGESFASEALRVLGIAYRSVPAKTEHLSHDEVKNLTFIGLVGMIDPPRPEVAEAIATAKRAGIRVIMKTGDHKATAIAIAKEVGILDARSPQEALTENDLANLSDDLFDEAVRTHSVFARVTPQTKMRIAQSLQRQGEVVAVTGDGVNDGPALRQADIGIAMGKIGTDVAREASDIILGDDNFATIINAIEEGRTVFRNTQQTSFYLVTTNIAESATILGALFLGLPLPLLPIQLLWMNIVTDGITDVALASEPKHDGILLEPPRKQSERILSKKMFPFLILMVVIMMTGTIALFLHALPESLEKARTLAFAFMGWAQLWNIWNMRSLTQSLFTIGPLTNRFVTIAFLAGIILQFIIINVPWFQNLFHFAPLSLLEWLVVILLSSCVLWFGEAYKLLKFKKQYQTT